MLSTNDHMRGHSALTQSRLYGLFPFCEIAYTVKDVGFVISEAQGSIYPMTQPMAN